MEALLTNHRPRGITSGFGGREDAFMKYIRFAEKASASARRQRGGNSGRRSGRLTVRDTSMLKRRTVTPLAAYQSKARSAVNDPKRPPRRAPIAQTEAALYVPPPICASPDVRRKVAYPAAQ
ncbi:hypothetical protein KCP74_10215 [Salmonella enterica subsp. enterica]|nr:hypothetical protein KCP74_10215 [Salmonella enterica subsp. enterica]